jgi:hypothetical protein
MSARTRSGWIAGLTVGAAGGFLALEFPSLGWLILLVFAVPAAIVGPRPAAIGGLLSGLGGVWLLLFGRVAITCEATGGEIGCHAPGIEQWLAAAAAILAIGLALTIVGGIRDRPRR